MTNITTNHELYDAVMDLLNSREASAIPLDQFLRALLHVTRPHRAEESLTLDLLFDIVRDAVDCKNPPEFDESWRELVPEPLAQKDGYEAWEFTCIMHIVDFVEMREAGILENEHRYFGLTSPRGCYWCNFDVIAFWECGLTGALEGWRPQGIVQMINEEGRLVEREVSEEDSAAYPPIFISTISWDEFSEILECGGSYE